MFILLVGDISLQSSTVCMCGFFLTLKMTFNKKSFSKQWIFFFKSVILWHSVYFEVIKNDILGDQELSEPSHT